MKSAKVVCALVISGVAPAAMATNGYFDIGYGNAAKGMGGVGVALPQDALAAAANPAGITLIGNRLDIGMDVFMPRRSAEIVNNGMPAAYSINGSWSGDGNKTFLIPSFGYNRMIDPNMAVGVAVFGNGGMNTRYRPVGPFSTGAFAQGGWTGDSGVNLEQLFIAPTFAMKVAPAHSLGASLVVAHQRFGITGVQAFGQMTGAPNNLTDKGNDSTTGVGVRLGWQGQIAPNLSVGATYASKISGKFNEYKGLFADGGKFDIPENYALGVAFKASPQVMLALDIERINYKKVGAVGNPINGLFAGTPLGASCGPGFGWNNMTVYKLGASYDVSKDLTVRAGFNYGKQPIPASQTFFNILAPGVVEKHLTLGATWKLSKQADLSVNYVHAFEKKLSGSGSIPAAYGMGEANIQMYQNSIGMSLGYKLD